MDFLREFCIFCPKMGYIKSYMPILKHMKIDMSKFWYIKKYITQYIKITAAIRFGLRR